LTPERPHLALFLLSRLQVIRRKELCFVFVTILHLLKLNLTHNENTVFST
jgi:hypothetical protein